MPVLRRVLAWLLLIGLAGLDAGRNPAPAEAQVGQGWRLFGHDNGRFSIVEIDTQLGSAREVGPTGFRSSAAAMSAARGPVPGPASRVFPAGAFFGLLADADDGRDYVTVADPTTGRVEKLVATRRSVGGRGIAFGPDGVTLHVLETDGELSTLDTVTGELRWLATVRNASGQTFGASSLEFDLDRGTFLAIASVGGSNQLIQISPFTGRAVVLGDLPGIAACTLVRAPAAIPGPGGTDLPAGSWLTFDSNKGQLLLLDVDLAARTAGIDRRIGSLGMESSGTICGAAFAAPVPPPPSPTPPPTSSPTPDRPPTLQATETAGCVCREVRAQVPPAIISDALANPGRYWGWRQRLDPNKPPSPSNPLRECLTLVDRNIAYHPLWNAPIWRVGCP